MRSILTITSAAESRDLTTLARLKQDLGITDTSQNLRLNDLIAGVSRAVESYIGWDLPRETISEAIRLECEAPESILLTRTPVVSITSVTLDGELLDSSLYEVNKDTGELFATDAAGYRNVWISALSVIVVYVAGYALPGDEGRNLPPDIELGALAWMRGTWLAQGRDPLVKSREIPGVITQEFWVGQVGQSAAPPEAAAFLDAYRRLP